MMLSKRARDKARVESAHDSEKVLQPELDLLAELVHAPAARELNDLARIDERLVRATILLLQPLGVGLGHTQPVHDVTRDVVAAEGDRTEMADLSLVEDGEVGGAGTHLHQRHTELLLIFGE